MELKDDEMQCPNCKNKIPKEVTICPYCKFETKPSVSKNIGAILTSIGLLLTVFITIPILLTTCGLCSIR